MASGIAIGRLASLTGVKITTIRYYEGIGLLPMPSRTEGKRRVYHQGDVQRLVFIRRSRALGLSMTAIRALLDLERNPGDPCQDATRIAEIHLADIEHRITQLEDLKERLQSLIGRCRGGKVEDCLILKDLSDMS